jgi:hypothetical protein
MARMVVDMGRKVFRNYAVYGGLLLVPFIAFTVVFIAIGQDSPDLHQKLTREDKKMTGLTRQELVRRAAPLGNPVLTTLEKPETVVEHITTAYFSNGGIYRVSTRPPDRPRVYNLGVWGADGIEVLNNEPGHYFDLAAKSGLTLRVESDYIAYVTTFIDVTRDFTGGVQVLNTIEESWWLPTPTPEEARRREEIIAKYAKVVEAPSLSRESSATVVVFLIRDRALIRMHAKVESDGRIEISENVLEAEMPTVMLR